MTDEGATPKQMPSSRDSLHVALQSLESVATRGRIARLAVIRAVFESLAEGRSVADLIGACPVEPPAQRSSFEILTGYQPMSREQAFVDWMVGEFRALLTDLIHP